MIKLNEPERQELQSLLAAFSSRAQYKITLNALLNNWRRFVADVEHGYPAEAYDYDNDLASRDLLQELLEQGSTALQTQLSTLLAPWDERFRVATDERSEPLIGDPPRNRWWWYCVPKAESQD